MPKSKIILKIFHAIIRVLPFIIVIIIGVPVVGMASIEAAKLMGLRKVPVPVMGTGSMYPSLFWSKSEGGPEDEGIKVVEEYRTTPHLYKRYDGIDVLGHTFFRRDIGHGDMVAFKNTKTQEILKADNKDDSAGFIKRVVGSPGDTIELRDGFVYKNGGLLSEPYIDSARSTYGGTSIKDCEVITVPSGSYLVLGDNRKVSSDSRFELGLVKDVDIEFLLPLVEQKNYQPLWHDTSKDSELLGSPSLSVDEFLSLINTERSSKGIAKLRLVPSLVKSSAERGKRLLQNEDTDYDMSKAIANAGYSNIVIGEFVSHGRFTAKELLENLLFNSGTAKQIMSSEYTDMGVSAVNLEVDGCPTQVIVGHLGGYIPAEYGKDTLNSWRGLRENLRTVIPSWEKAQNYSTIDQSKLGSLLVILGRRLSLAEEVLSIMEKKEWLSKNLESRIKDDRVDAQEAELLSKELNKE